MEKNQTYHGCPGFSFSGIDCGIKKKKDLKDLGLIYAHLPSTSAAVFTTNLVQAAPVVLDKQRIQLGKCQALIANSGCANCCTGTQGLEDAKAMTHFVADALKIDDEQVFVASTGVIGEPLDISKIQNSMPKLIDSLSEDRMMDFAQSIMTTDTYPKVVSNQWTIGEKKFTITATAKGAGMIRPDMATLLCFICTDIQANKYDLSIALKKSVDKSFNIITIDGDTSTNDTVLIMANGLSELDINHDDVKTVFQQALDDTLVTLAKMVVKDGEGVTKLVTVTVKGADNDSDAKKIASTVAHSSLVKTAIFGEDANWGRILAAAGRAGVIFNPKKVDIYFDSAKMVEQGIGCGKQVESEVSKILKKQEFSIIIDLKMGMGQFSMYTCDFSIDYVKINADYRT